ncbi:ATP-binding protein [Iningainema tapete]|uniref:ATP-binding protein n=1 Tax=Iningainema tapete BLCC-T55 TaxID=2748662 RepID=A0A8J6XLH0_9CYAN|nr:ATP-binding protein [Iningainema tapete]MBD2772627.1 ATP-binding protein [Iningainema tapete BLCC-T55]
MYPTAKFPVELLTATNAEKLNYFSNFTIVHRRLKQAYEKFIDAVNNPGGASLIILFGPTGVGKTTLLHQVVKVLIEQNQANMMLDSAHIPVATVEARSPDNGSFDWKDYYKSVLIALGEPFTDYKIKTGSSRVYGSGAQQKTVKLKPTLADLRADVEQIIKLRQLVVFLVDEAQRFTKIASGRRQQDQMDAIQSMASFTATRSGLFGTYELLQFRNLSGQLSRRSIDIHFPRYQNHTSEDITDFQRVLKSFALAMPLESTPDFEKDWEYFYERSIGCVGIVKDWLTQAYRKALSENSTSLKSEYLNYYAPSVSKCMQMLTEAIEGEKSLVEDEVMLEKLRQKLGMKNPNGHHNNPKSPPAQNSNVNNTEAARKKRSQPGERKPYRDTVGGG